MIKKAKPLLAENPFEIVKDGLTYSYQGLFCDNMSVVAERESIATELEQIVNHIENHITKFVKQCDCQECVVQDKLRTIVKELRE